ncbi:hypothetical protein [Dechloromonas sp. CZR5]|uniref:DUF6988 family protein n=1 Tax=Dechloromonas sp. CZR5 TaxID=2608630 RepID=UPI00123C9FE2|nr:hypothetical protein [Dechloromonas sp. CZR5]
MSSKTEQAKLIALIHWIDQTTGGLSLPADEKSMIAAGCFDVVLEHQAAIAALYSVGLNGSLLAILRVLAESLIRGLWLTHAATERDIHRFKKGKLPSIKEMIDAFESTIDTPNGVLSRFKETGWNALCGFTHTGFNQITRRHSPGLIGSNYADSEIAKALGVAGALGLIAASQIVGMAGREDLVDCLMERMNDYAALP